MRHLLPILAISCASVFVTACGGGDGSGPVIDSVTPGSGAPGATIELSGARFCGTDAEVDPDGTCTTPPAGRVEFGTDAPVLRGTIASWTDEAITVTVPAAASAGATTLLVRVNDEVSNAVSFTVE